MKKSLCMAFFLVLLASSLSAEEADQFSQFTQTALHQQLQLWSSWSSWRFWSALLIGGIAWLALQLGCASIEEKLQARTSQQRHESFLDITCALTGATLALFWLLIPEGVFSLMTQGDSSSAPHPVIKWTLLGLGILLCLNLLYLLFNTVRHYNLLAGTFRLLTVPPVALLLALIVCLSILALSYIAVALSAILIITMLIQALSEGVASSINNPSSTSLPLAKNTPPIDPTAKELDNARRGIASSRYPDGKIPTEPF